MPAKPSEYFWREVHWPDDPEGEPDWEDHDMPSLGKAKLAAKDYRGYASVYRRVNIIDVTPYGDPRGTLWEWDTELIGEY